MCPPVIAVAGLVASLASTAVAVQSASAQGKAAENQANYQAQVGENAARVAANNARLTRLQGDEAAQQEQKHTGQQLGAQRAAFGASGVDPNSGSALGIQVDTAAAGGLSAENIRYNSLLRGMSLAQDSATGLSNAGATRIAGQNAFRQGQTGALGAGLSGASSFGSKWDSFQKAGGFSGVGSSLGIT